MFDILSLIPGKKKRTTSGWTSVNAPCCHNLGHKPDKRMRGGFKFGENSSWIYHCFNCGFKCSFALGHSIYPKTRKFLLWCGADDEDIGRWSLESLQHKSWLSTIITPKNQPVIKFERKDDPAGAVRIDDKNPTFDKYVSYLTARKISTEDYVFKATPDETGRNSNRIIIPYIYNGVTVGHTSRYLDDRTPKYINENQQPGFVFGTNLQKPEWQTCLVFEGIFDAISMGGCALMHNTISNEQAVMLHKLQKRIIVVPDQDKSGLEIIDRALEFGFHVSLPMWKDGIKDANDALIKYGKLPTLLSILQNATTSRIKLEMGRKKIDQRL